jgi:hypothetical protein
VQLGLALAFIVVLPAARGQRPKHDLRPLDPFTPAPPLVRPIWLQIVPSVQTPVSFEDGGPSFDEVPLREKWTPGQDAYDAVQNLEHRPEYSQQRSDALAQLAKRLSNRQVSI